MLVDGNQVGNGAPQVTTLNLRDPGLHQLCANARQHFARLAFAEILAQLADLARQRVQRQCVQPGLAARHLGQHSPKCRQITAAQGSQRPGLGRLYQFGKTGLRQFGHGIIG